jgi:hypothetical protein
MFTACYQASSTQVERKGVFKEEGAIDGRDFPCKRNAIFVGEAGSTCNQAIHCTLRIASCTVELIGRSKRR